MTVSRRLVLRCTPCAVGSLAAWSCGSPSADLDASVPMPDAGQVTELRVPLSSLDVGGFVALGDPGTCATNPRGAIVGRDPSGVYAFSNSCTHQHGTVAPPDAQGIARCCLHGAEYDGTGAVTSGIVPGQSPLPQWQVRLDGSELVVRVGETVDRGTRLPV